MDAAEFDRWYATAYPRLVGQVALILGDRAEAQDAVQEAFVRFWDRRASLIDVSSRDAWIRTTAHRYAVSRWRRLARGRELIRTLPEQRTPPEPNPDRAVLVAALRKLPEAQRHTVVLHYIADRSIAQIAAELGVAEGTVKSRLHHARAALAPLLDDTTTRTPGGSR